MRKVRFVSILSAVLLLAASPAMAGTWYIGGGINSVSLGGDLDDVDSGSGFAFNFGYNFNPTFALDFLLGGSGHEDPDGFNMGYGRFDIGAEFIMDTGGPFAPYMTVGLGSHVLDYDDYNTSLQGGSLYFGGGFDYYFTPGHSLDVGLRFHSWSVDVNQGGVIWTDVGDATTTVLTIMYNYHFIM
ncbi:MAG: outer membrane beta-barrel protein [bacterium]|nr:outer membrane beta-barrel protein [bacterium]